MENNENVTPVVGVVEAAAKREAETISATVMQLASGQKAALVSCLYAGVALMRLCHPLPSQGEAIKFEDARNLLTGSLKKSAEVNDAFIERAVSIGRKLALWLGNDGKEVRATLYQQNTLEQGIAFLQTYLSTNHGVRDREAIAKWLTKDRAEKVDLHPGSTVAAKAAAKIGAAEAADFAAGLLVALSDAARGALVKACREFEAAVLKADAEAAAAKAAAAAAAALAGESEAPEPRTGTEG